MFTTEKAREKLRKAYPVKSHNLCAAVLGRAAQSQLKKSADPRQVQSSEEVVGVVG